MKRTPSILRSGPFLILVVLLFGPTGCSDPSSGTGEPNDSILDAGLLENERAVSMRIDSSGDRDWFAIALEGDGYVELGTKRVPEKLQLRARFAEKTPWKARKKNWLGDWDTLPRTKLFREIDTAYFVVRDKRGGSSKKAFRIRAKFVEEFDEHEPNDEGEEAVKIDLEESMRSYVYPRGDRDLFRIDLERTGYLRARAEATPDELGAEVRFLRREASAGRLLPISGYRKFPAAASINEEGEYFVELGDDHDDAQSRKPIEWGLEFVPQMDSTEPNARWKDAHPLLLGKPLKIALFPKGDRDHFRIVPRRSMELRLEAKDAQGVTPQLQLVRDGESGHENLSEWKGLPADFSLEGGEEYFLILRAKGDEGGSPDPFILRARKKGEMS
jgi:hypothetical protein